MIRNAIGIDDAKGDGSPLLKVCFANVSLNLVCSLVQRYKKNEVIGLITPLRKLMLCNKYLYYLAFSVEVSLMMNTEPAPRIKRTPARTSILTCEPPTNESNRPPIDAAII